MFGQHDHDRIDPREMFRFASRAAPRPSASDDFALLPAGRAMAVPAVPGRQAGCRGEQRGITWVQVSQGTELRPKVAAVRADW
jgi:hypothetical protein